MSKPTFILIVGSWHSPSHAQPLIDLLEARGHRAQAYQLAQTGIKAKRPLFEDDVAVIRPAVERELDDGHDVCLVLHSYAGMSGAEAVNQLMKDGYSEAMDGKGKLVRVIFLAAYAFPAGVPLDARAMVGPDNPDYTIDVHCTCSRNI
jgi:hypothetical protein